MYVNLPQGFRAEPPKQDRKIVTQTAGRRQQRQEQRERRRLPDRRKEQKAITFANRRAQSDRRGAKLLTSKDLTQATLENPLGNTINTKI